MTMSINQKNRFLYHISVIKNNEQLRIIIKYYEEFTYLFRLFGCNNGM